MARATSKTPAKASPGEKAPETVPTNNRGRELLELRIRWKIANETLEAAQAERKRLREAIDALSGEMKQVRPEE